MGRGRDNCPWLLETHTDRLQPFNGWSIKTTDGHTIDGATVTGAQTELGSSDCYGFDMDAAGESATLLWPVPKNLDVTAPIKFNVCWAPIDGTITQNVTWKVLYSINVCESGVAVAAPATALNTPITADAENDTAESLQLSPTGILDGGNITEAQRDAGCALSLYVETDLISAGNGGKFVWLDVVSVLKYIA